MRLVGFLQVRNELSTGHLQRFMKVNGPLIDHLYAYDDASDDGTYEYLVSSGATVIKGQTKRFGQELYNKSDLLDLVQLNEPDGTAILWLDADEVIFASRSEIENLISPSFESGFDGIQLPHINLWRSEDWYRTDNLYDSLTPVRLWKLSSALHFPRKPGLHQQMWPMGIRAVRRLAGPSVVHYGFATTELILKKYANYRLHWQTGYALHRLINEDGLATEPLKQRAEWLGERYAEFHPGKRDPQPQRLSPAEWYTRAESEMDKSLSQIVKPKVTLACLIYASNTWLEFEYAELLRLQKDLPKGEVEILFLANDATPEVKRFLAENNIPHICVSTKAEPDEWFINSVYRAYNLAVEHAKGEYVLLVNSDMAYAPGALVALMAEASPQSFLASRLVEMGVFPTGEFGLEKNFGSKPKNFRRTEFVSFARKIATPRVAPGGLYMPLLVNRKAFLDLGGYPEGNVVQDDFENYLAGLPYRIAKQGEKAVTGDKALMEKAALSGTEHKTVFDSIAYHFQAGERRDKSRRSRPSGLAVVNDSLIGINGEVVLWEQIASRLEDSKIRVQRVSTGFPDSAVGSLLNPLRLWIKAQVSLRQNQKPRVVFSNATWQVPLWGNWRNVVLRQDRPEQFGYRWLQGRNLSNAQLVLANDAEYVAGNQGLNVRWVLVPLGDTWWEKEPVAGVRSNRKIVFIGAFNETKGWSQVKELIEKDSSLNWALVSKYLDDDPGFSEGTPSNVEIYRRLPQKQLRSLLQESAVLVMASPYETQNLASLEAASLNVVVVTKPTGFLGEFGEGRQQFGVVTNDLLEGIRDAVTNITDFAPKAFLEQFGLVSEVGWEKWTAVLEEELKASFIQLTEPGRLIAFAQRLVSFLIWLKRRVMRNYVFPIAISLKRWLLSKLKSA